MYSIEKGIEIPKSQKKNLKYPFRNMEIGDSFFVEKDRRLAAYSIVSQFARQNPPMKFTTRVVDGGVRVWRIQ